MSSSEVFKSNGINTPNWKTSFGFYVFPSTVYRAETNYSQGHKASF